MNPDCSTVHAYSSGAQRLGILEGWIGEMANDDHVEGMVAQTHGDVSVMIGQWATRVTWFVCVGRLWPSPTGLLATCTVLLLVYCHTRFWKANRM
jgi:hypothetical protein